GEVRRGHHHVSRTCRAGGHPTRWRQREEAGHRHVVDAVSLRERGTEVAEVHAGNVVRAHVVAELEEALSPIEARVREQLVTPVSATAVLTGVGQEMWIVG